MIANNRTLWLNYPDTHKEIGFTGCLYLWWPLLLCRAIAIGFHPTTYKVSPWSSKAIILPKTKIFYYPHHLNQSVWLTDSIEFQDATLLESLSNYIHYNTTMKSLQEAHGITSTHGMSMFLTPNPHFISSIIISCQCTTNQPMHISFHTKHHNNT